MLHQQQLQMLEHLAMQYLIFQYHKVSLEISSLEKILQQIH